MVSLRLLCAKSDARLSNVKRSMDEGTDYVYLFTPPLHVCTNHSRRWWGGGAVVTNDCNHCPPPTHLRGIVGQRLFIHRSPCNSHALRGLAESHSPALYSKFYGGYWRNTTSPHLPGTAGASKIHCSVY